MSSSLRTAREVSADDDRFAYSFCTLVNDLDEYALMLDAFAAKGFTADDCEFLYIDNSRANRFDAFDGLNRMLARAAGRHVVLCHQDVLPIEDGRARLDELLEDLYRTDGQWGVCGNAGADARGDLVVRISDPWGADREAGGPFPRRVMSLDENFIVVRRDANLALSRDLGGYHWYGADLCIMAETLGWTSYVIDFHLAHRSGGNKDGQFFDARRRFRRKFNRAFRSRWHFVPTKEPVFVSGSAPMAWMRHVHHRIGATAAKAARKLKS